VSSFGERDLETAVIAIPIFLYDGFAISGLRTRLTPVRIEQIGPLLVAKAEALSKLLEGIAPTATGSGANAPGVRS
jgi:DNA-binding IclR family transcriptional regulator